MIKLSRLVELPFEHGARRFHCLRQPGFRAYVTHLEGLVHDGRALGEVGVTAGFGRELTVVLDGVWVDRRGGERALAAGELLLADASPLLTDRWEAGAWLLTFEWHDRPAAARVQVGKIDQTLLASCRDFARLLASARPIAEQERALLELLEALRAEGLDVPPPVISPVPAEVQRLASLLNGALTKLHESPALSDFGTEKSERQVRRDLKEWSPWLGLIGDSWRSTLATLRLQYATALVTSRHASLAEVAAALGYRSDRALLTALKRAGLPAPSEIKRAVR